MSGHGEASLVDDAPGRLTREAAQQGDEADEAR